MLLVYQSIFMNIAELVYGTCTIEVIDITQMRFVMDIPKRQHNTT